MHLYQIDLAFRGRTIDYVIVANSQILKDFTTGWYRWVGINKKTGYLYSAFTNRGDNSLELTTLENGKFVKKVYTLPKELTYKFIYENKKSILWKVHFTQCMATLLCYIFKWMMTYSTLALYSLTPKSTTSNLKKTKKIPLFSILKMNPGFTGFLSITTNST
jgi:hypothetical protein